MGVGVAGSGLGFCEGGLNLPCSEPTAQRCLQYKSRYELIGLLNGPSDKLTSPSMLMHMLMPMLHVTVAMGATCIRTSNSEVDSVLATYLLAPQESS